MIKKRGQVAIYVVLGIIILSTLVVISYLRFSGEKDDIKGTPESYFNEVETHVEGCISQVLEEGVGFWGVRLDNVGDYEANLADYIKLHLPLCVNLLMFEGVESYRIDKVIVSVDDMEINVHVIFPITVKAKGVEKKFTDFVSEYPLKEEGCVDVSIDSNCMALESKTVHLANIIFEYNVGDFVGVGNECIAC